LKAKIFPWDLWVELPELYNFIVGLALRMGSLVPEKRDNKGRYLVGL